MRESGRKQERQESGWEDRRERNRVRGTYVESSGKCVGRESVGSSL